MRFFTAIIFSVTILVFFGIPESAFAQSPKPRDGRPHEIWYDCGSPCESTCDHILGEGDACIAMCKRAWFCEAGYIREVPDGRCIRQSECPPKRF